MNKYEADWFDHGEWRTIILELLAESEEQVRRLVDQRCPAWGRDKPYKFPSGAPFQDTLKVRMLQENIQFPLVLNEC